MKKPVALLLAVVGLVAGASIGEAQSSSSRERVFQGYPLVKGRLVDGAGNPLTGHVSLFLSVPGVTEAKPPVLGSTDTDATGRFTIASPKPTFVPLGSETEMRQKALEGIKLNDGWANIDLVASDGKVVVYRSLARHIVPSPIAAFADASGGLSIGTVTVAPGAAGAIPIGQRASSAAHRTAPGPSCVETVHVLGRPVKMPTVVGELHAAGDSHETFIYGRKAYSDIDVGFAPSSGPFSLVGETHIGNTLGGYETWDSASGDNDKRLLAVFEYQQFSHRVIGPCATKRFHTIAATFKTIAATAWDYGQSRQGPAKDLSNGCRNPKFSTYRDSFAPGPPHGFTRIGGRAATFKIAVTVFGVSLGATTGYSSSATLRWTAGSKHKVYFACASDDDPSRAKTLIFTGFAD